jgi:hypothetical protein
MDDAPLITVPSNAKYSLPITPVSKGVRKDGDMIGKVNNLKFMDHDITDTKNFPELARDQYLCTETGPATGKNWVEAHAWASALEKARILTLFKIPHFRRSNEINACVKVLLSCVHGGTLWLDPMISINTTLIVRITLLSKACEDSALLFLKMGE